MQLGLLNNLPDRLGHFRVANSGQVKRGMPCDDVEAADGQLLDLRRVSHVVSPDFVINVLK